MITIDPTKEYALKEILAEQLIPGVTGYNKLYSLVTYSVDGEKGKYLVTETTADAIKPMHRNSPGTKINQKIKVSGVELIKFLRLNGLIK